MRGESTKKREDRAWDVAFGVLDTAFAVFDDWKMRSTNERKLTTQTYAYLSGIEILLGSMIFNQLVDFGFDIAGQAAQLIAGADWKTGSRTPSPGFGFGFGSLPQILKSCRTFFKTQFDLMVFVFCMTLY